MEGIEADEAPAEYYNLQGVKLAESELGSGIFVEKRGSKAKLVVKH